MRNRNQVVLPIELKICIPEDDPVLLLDEICRKLVSTASK